MKEGKKEKKYDLEERTFEFARDIRNFSRKVPMTLSNFEDFKQLIRATGSVGANYIEANENVGDKDFIFRIKLCRKESKESRFFLRLIYIDNNEILEKERLDYIREATELMNIFGAIIRNKK